MHLSKRAGFGLLTFLSLLLGACGSVDQAVYDGQEPALNLREFLSGNLTGWGIFQDRSGEVSHRFRIDMQAEWDGARCRFVEDFHFTDGRHQRREWKLVEGPAGHFTALANDSAEAGEGSVHGNTLHWRYVINTQTEYGTLPLTYDYWMFKIDRDTLMNRADVSVYGIRVGEVSVLFRRQTSP